MSSVKLFNVQCLVHIAPAESRGEEAPRSLTAFLFWFMEHKSEGRAEVQQPAFSIHMNLNVYSPVLYSGLNAASPTPPSFFLLRNISIPGLENEIWHINNCTPTNPWSSRLAVARCWTHTGESKGALFVSLWMCNIKLMTSYRDNCVSNDTRSQNPSEISDFMNVHAER